MAPARTSVPPKALTPSRWALESRPLRVEPPPLVLDMSLYLLFRLCGRGGPGADTGDLDSRVALAVAPLPAAPGLRLVGKAADLGPLDLSDHPGRDPGRRQLVVLGQH